MIERHQDECACVECGSSEGGMYMHSRCHPKAPTWAVYYKDLNKVDIICSVCEKPIIVFALQEKP